MSESKSQPRTAEKSTAQLESRRFPTHRKISFQLDSDEKPRHTYLLNLSMTGMFVRCEDPPPPGSLLSFELFVDKDESPIRGQAQVVWARNRDDGHDRPQGMGVHITRMEPSSRQQLRQIVEVGLAQMGELTETDQLRSVVEDALVSVDDSPAEFLPAAPVETEAPEPAEAPVAAVPPMAGTYYRGGRARNQGFDIVALAALLLLLGIGGSLFYLQSEPVPEPVPGTSAAVPAQEPPATLAQASPPPPAQEAPAEPAQEPAAVAVQAPPAAAAAPPPAPVQAEPPAPAPPPAAAEPAGPDHSKVAEAVESWASAWSDQDVEAYLGSYARDFKPPRGRSRRQWEAYRRDRVSAPEFIRVAISRLETERLSDDRARASFYQAYRSDRMGDTVSKVLDLVWEDGRWKILNETVIETIS